MSAISLLDRTTATVSQGDGIKELPAVLLTPEEAALLGEYASWLSKSRLSAKLFCNDCGPQHEVEVYIDPQKIGIICQHRMVFYEGPVPVVETLHPDAGTPITVVRVVVPETKIQTADAYLLRRYQKFVLKHGFKEALWCLKCEDEGEASGMRAYVTASSIALICRCQMRTFVGLTI